MASSEAMGITRLDRLTGPEWEELHDITFLLPTGSVEQHGDHLPVGTDALIAQSVCERACSKAGDLLLAPPIPYGVSDHHKRLPGGAVSAGVKAYAAYVSAIVSELVDPARNRAVVILNGHGGNWPAITYALDELGAVRGELPVGACSWWDLIGDSLEGIDPAVRGRRPGHGGAVETSIVLALEPSAVRANRRDSQTTVHPAGELPLHRWLDFSLHFQTGVVGTPSMADASIGERLLDEASDQLVRLARALRV